MVEVFRDGDLCIEWTFEEIRARAVLQPRERTRSWGAPRPGRERSAASEATASTPNAAAGCCDVM